MIRLPPTPLSSEGDDVPLLELHDLSFSYPTSHKKALERITLSIGEGEYVAVVGPNGSGKSSLLRIISGLLAPSSGTICVARPSRAVGLVFQSPADQIVSSSVEEDVAFGPENQGLPREEIRRIVDSSLAAVGLADKAKTATQFLSAGQQQRLAVAGALASDARCFAFDEATAMLDPEARDMVLALMETLVASGKAVIHVTHDMDEAERASRILVLDAGALVFDGCTTELFCGPVAPDAPYARALKILGLPPAVVLARKLGFEPVAREKPEELASRIAMRLSRPAVKTTGARQESTVAEAPSGAKPVYELKGAGHVYLHGTSSEVHALRNLDFVIPKGARVAFVGRTGSGKSTALQLLDGLVSPSEGSAFAFGLDLSAPGTDLRSVRVDSPLAVQRPESALFEVYAADDVAFGPRNIGLSGKALVERVRQSMGEAGLPYDEYRDRLCRSLSGGEKRRLALAGVLAMGGRGLLLDEPTSALDPESKKAVRALVAHRSLDGTTVAIATHSMEEAAESDLVAVFSRGELAALCDPLTLFYDRFDPEWGIARPFAIRVAIELETLGIELLPRPLTESQLEKALVQALE
jgi:energy-coupling factor transport system ATP-binding protein